MSILSKFWSWSRVGERTKEAEVDGDKGSTPTPSLTWREVCREAAAQQAEAEARAAWKLKPKAKLPFNHRWEHVQEVVRLALWLAKTTGADAEIVEASAWLHDIAKTEHRHGIVGAKRAAEILATTDFPAHKILAVAGAIRQHVGMTRPDDAEPLQPLEAAILWDADKLSKLGIQAIVYSLSTTYMRGKTLAERRQDMTSFVNGVLSRTVTSMNTAPARKLAEERHRAMQKFLAQWEREEQGQELLTDF